MRETTGLFVTGLPMLGFTARLDITSDSRASDNRSRIRYSGQTKGAMIMATQTLTAKNFEETITNNDLVFVDFWATWCGPCKAFGPVYEKASEANPDIVFGKVDIDQNQDLATAAEIQAVPTLMIAKKGQIIFKQAGALRASDLDEVIKQARALDVNAKESANA